jgi:hypothetical protein
MRHEPALALQHPMIANETLSTLEERYSQEEAKIKGN